MSRAPAPAAPVTGRGDPSPYPAAPAPDARAPRDAEAALRESEAAHRTLLASLPVIVYRVEPRPPYTPLYVSPGVALLGYTHAEWMAAPDTWLRILHPDDRARVVAETEAALAAGRPLELVYRVLAKDGTVRWIQDRGAFAREAGEPTTWQGVMLDVTARRATEDALRESEARFRAVFENAAVGVSVVDAAGVVVQANAAFEAFLGYGPGELLGRYAPELSPPEDAAVTRGPVWAMHAGRRRSATVEKRFVRRDGEIRWASLTLSPITLPDGGAGVVGVTVDVTDRRVAEAALRESEARFRMALDGGRHAYAVLRSIPGPDGAPEDFEYLEVNETFESMCGRAAEEVVGTRFTELWPVSRTDGMLQGYRRVATTGEPFEAERENLDPRVSARWLSVQVMPLADGVATLARDITPQKEAEAERRLLQDVTHVLSRAPDAAHAIAAALEALCSASGWEYGEAWLTPRADAAGASVLSRGPVWHAPGDDGLAAYASASAAYTFAPGEELPGRVWREAAPVVLPALDAADAGFARVGEARAAGLRTGVGVPVLADGAVVAVLTFHTRDARRITGAQVERLSAVAGQVGAVVRRQLAESALRESEAQFRGVLETVRSVAVTLDAEGRVTFANDALLSLTGCARDEVVGRDWFARFLPDGERFRPSFRAMLRGDASVPHFEAELLARGGARRMIAWDVTLLRDGSGAVTGTASIGRDVTEQRALEQRLAALSEHDELTGLLNRRGFRRMLEQSVKAAGRTGARDALLLLDLDRFKPINDGYGHAEGDRALRAVGELLRATVRDADFAARFGGDEFAVYAVGLRGGGEAHVLASRLQAGLAEHNREAAAAGRPYAIEFSIGVAEVEPGDDAESLFARADAALYARKLARR